MKKLIVRILNLVYLVGVALSAVALWKKPILNLNLSVSIPKEKIGELLSEVIPSDEEEDEETKAIKREGGSSLEDFQITDYLTAEKISDAFEDDLKFTIDLQVPAKIAFNLEDKEALGNIVAENIDDVITNLIETVLPPFQTLIKNVTGEIAKAVIQDTLNEQLQEYFTGSSVSAEEVDAIFNNVYDLLNGDEEVTVDDLTNALMGEKNEDGTYSDGILKILNEQSDGDKEYTAEDVEEMSGGAIVDKLNEVPGLVNTTYTEWIKDPAEFEAKRDAGELYILVGEEYKKLDSDANYDVTVTYYVIESQTVNNIDDALAFLLSEAMGTSSEDDKENEEETKLVLKRGETAPEQSELEKTIEDLIRSKLPIDSIKSTVNSVGGYAPMACMILLAVSAFPWALFGLVTIIRTLRKNKCWTKPWIVFVFGFPQVILGLGLTLAGKFGLSYAGTFLADYKWLIDAAALNLKTSLYVPSLIYLAMIPFTIIYAIFAHSVKVDYKLDKKLKL